MDTADHYLWMHFELLAEQLGYDDLRTMTALETWLRSFTMTPHPVVLDGLLDLRDRLDGSS